MSYPVLERPFPVFCLLLEKGFWPGKSRDRGVCPETFAPALVPGQRDTGTNNFLCPGKKGTTSCPLETLLHTNQDMLCVTDQHT